MGGCSPDAHDVAVLNSDVLRIRSFVFSLSLGAGRRNSHRRRAWGREVCTTGIKRAPASTHWRLFKSELCDLLEGVRNFQKGAGGAGWILEVFLNLGGWQSERFTKLRLLPQRAQIDKSFGRWGVAKVALALYRR